MSQNGDLWEVARIPVLVSAQTELSTQPVVVGDAVRVRGYTQLGNTVMAERVDLLPAGIPLPDVEDDDGPSDGRKILKESSRIPGRTVPMESRKAKLPSRRRQRLPRWNPISMNFHETVWLTPLLEVPWL